MSKPYYQDSKITIIQGHILDVLPTLPDKSVHCVVTSPPYWGLRDYGLPPQVWSCGCEVDHSEGCEHEWGKENPPIHAGQIKHTKDGGASSNLPSSSEGGNAPTGQFCQKCQAWRGSLGLEPDPDLYIQHIVQVFREIWRVLRKDGTVWLNMGDSYASGGRGLGGNIEFLGEGTARAQALGPKTAPDGLKPKDLCMIPARVALALQADGWWLRSDIIWSKPNSMPESVTDRPTRSHEYVFLLTKAAKYFWDADAVREPHSKSGGWKTPDGWDTSTGDGGHGSFHKQGREKGQKGYYERKGGISKEDYEEKKWLEKTDGVARPPMTMKDREYNPAGRNLRSVWTIATQPFPDAHFATFPEKLVEPCIKAGTSEKGCCPECGAPWVRVVEKTQVKSPKTSRPEVNRAAVGDGISDSSTFKTGLLPQSKTIGWKPSCECYKKTHLALIPYDAIIPCTVLDPFGGSGRTAIVAKKLGRKCIIIELKGEYCEMPLKKLSQELIF